MKTNYKITCFYCGKEISRKFRRSNHPMALSFHHFFNRYDVRKRLQEIFEDTNQGRIQDISRLVFINIPKLPVHVSCHRTIEEKLK